MVSYQVFADLVLESAERALKNLRREMRGPGVDEYGQNVEEIIDSAAHAIVDYARRTESTEESRTHMDTLEKIAGAYA